MKSMILLAALAFCGVANAQTVIVVPAQVEADFALRLGSAWSFRADPERVDILEREVERKHAVAVERFQKKLERTAAANKPKR